MPAVSGHNVFNKLNRKVSLGNIKRPCPPCTQKCFQGVCLAVMTCPFIPQEGYSALKPMITYQTLSQQVSDAGGLEQETTFPF